MRSQPFLVYVSCSFSMRTMTTLPGSIPGSWSPSPRNVIFWPSSIPLSTLISRIFLSFFVLLPVHTPQMYFGFILSPSPPHLSQTVCICWIIPGPSWRCLITTPAPLQTLHLSTLSLLSLCSGLTPSPSHVLHKTVFCNANFLVTPL